MGGPSRYVRRGRPAPSPRLWHDVVEDEEKSYDYSGIEVLDMEHRYNDTGLVFPDGEPIYTEQGADLGFPITSDREEERE